MEIPLVNISVDDTEGVSVLVAEEVVSVTDMSDVDPFVDGLVVSVFDVCDVVVED